MNIISYVFISLQNTENPKHFSVTIWGQKEEQKKMILFSVMKSPFEIVTHRLSKWTNLYRIEPISFTGSPNPPIETSKTNKKNDNGYE